MKNLISINNLSKEEILDILKLARDIEENPSRFADRLKGKSMATMFFQPSTRTRISSSLAMQKLGGNVVDLYESKFEKGMGISESFKDTIRVIGDYVDLICLRHGLEEALLIAEKCTNAKIINCGNGKDQHPTQALLDLYTIWKEFGRLDNLKIAIIGDLKNSRSVHSLLTALSLFENNEVTLISPGSLQMDLDSPYLKRASLKIKVSSERTISDEDVIYVCELAHDEYNPETSFAKLGKYQITEEISKKLKPTSIILCPLPRIGEIDEAVDKLSHAKYFKQSENGVFVRMAIFLKILGEENESTRTD